MLYCDQSCVMLLADLHKRSCGQQGGLCWLAALVWKGTLQLQEVCLLMFSLLLGWHVPQQVGERLGCWIFDAYPINSSRLVKVLQR